MGEEELKERKRNIYHWQQHLKICDPKVTEEWERRCKEPKKQQLKAYVYQCVHHPPAYRRRPLNLLGNPYKGSDRAFFSLFKMFPRGR
jgi:hypothetical protein